MTSFLKRHISAPAQPSSIPFSLGLLAIAAIFTLLFSLTFTTFKYEYEERLGTLIWSLFPEQEREERITIIAIDEQSLAQIGPWPWPRKVMAELSNRLAEYGTSLQLYDIVFPEEKNGDLLLRDTLEANKGILAQIPIFDHQSQFQSGQLSGALSNSRCQFPIPNATSYLANSASLSVANVGHITPIVDSDGVVRKQPPLICVNGRVYPSLALQGLLSSLSSETPKVSLQRNSGFFSSEWQIAVDSYFGLSVPIDQQGNMRLSYRQSPDSFQVVSAVDVLNGAAPSSLLENTWALVGATAFGLGDIVPTPHSGVTPGVELQARLLSSLLDGRTPFTPSYSTYLLLAMAALSSAILVLLARARSHISAYALPISALALPVCAWAIHSLLLSHDIWLGWLDLALFNFMAGVLFVLADHRIIRHQHLRIFTHLSSYLPAPVAQGLLHSAPSSAIEARRHNLVLMCADLRNFSAYEESRPPEEAAALLHYFFVEATAIIESFKGQVEEYKGDSILASWPGNDHENTTKQAVEAANALQQMLADILPQHPPKGLEPLALGIGIERGSTLVGSIGPAHRRSHTILGDTVTITLRIQEMTQDLAQPILIGECAARDLNGEDLQSQGSFLLDGLTTPHVLFAPNSHHVDPLSDQDEKYILRVVRNH